jgi:hypothetical protein
MSRLLRAFVLTKREQRVIVIIVLLLVGATLVRHYRSPHIPGPGQQPASTPLTPPHSDEEPANRDESP